MSGSLIDAMASDLLAWFDRGTDGVPRRVLLWLDPESQFAALMPKVEPVLAESGVQVLQGERDAQVALKVALLELDVSDSGRAVVYLPGFARADLEPRADGGVPGLWAAYEYRYKGCVWGLGDWWEPGALREPPSLLNWLRSHGIKTADSRMAKTLTGGGPDSLLSRYTLKHSARVLADWPQPLRVSDVKSDLGGEPRDELRRLVIDPETTVSSWGPDAAVIVERLREKFGIELSLDEDPAQLADQSVIVLAMAEAWEALVESKDFPFLARLPVAVEHRRALAGHLRDDVLANEAARAAYRSRIQRLEPQYDLTAWAKGRSGSPAGLPGLARAQWSAFMSELDRATEGGWKSGRDFLLDHEDAIREGARGHWNAEGDGCHWAMLSSIMDLCRAATEAVQQVPKAKAAAEMVEAYTDRWYIADDLHLRVRDVCSQYPDLESVRLIADHAYFDYVSAVNERFSERVEAEAAWPPSGLRDVTSVRSQVWFGNDGGLERSDH